MEILQSLRGDIKSAKKTNSEVGVDQISASDPKPDPSKQPDLQKSPSTNHLSSKPSAELMETIQRFKSEIPSDRNSEQSKPFAAEKKQRNTQIKGNISLEPNMSLHLLPQRNLRPLCKSKSFLSPKGLLLNKTNKNQTQILYFIRK